jgi:cysteine desulfurase
MKKAVNTAVMCAYSTIHFIDWLFFMGYGIMRGTMRFTNWFSKLRPRAKAPARIYLDHAAATPLLPEVIAVMQATEAVHFANPSAIHAEGVAVRRVIDGARAKLARVLGVREPCIVFTGSGTESNNLAILGALYARHKDGVAYAEMEIITTAIEHPSVKETVAFAASLGVVVRTAPVDERGHIVRADFETLLSTRTVLVTFAYVNSEIGVVQEVGRFARAVRAFEREHGTAILVHLDAAQAPLWLPCNLPQLQIDLMSLDASKCGGPKGVGVVAMRHGVRLASVMFGGPQEGGLRPATENVVGIVGAVEALVVAQADYKERSLRVRQLRDRFMEALLQIEGLVINGDREARVANNVNVSVSGIDSEFAVVCLDVAGVACSTKSACSGAGGGGSTVVKAISGDAARATSTIRFTLGERTTWAELETTVSALTAHVARTLTFKKNLVQ